MKSFELQPTFENILKAFEDDLLDRNIGVVHFLDLIHSLESGGAIALDARWGAGKTFFVKQVKMVLDAFNDHVISDCTQEKERIMAAWDAIKMREKPDIQPMVTVYYDAWLNDNDDDPILSLVYTILQNVTTDFEFQKGPECIEAAVGIVEVFTGRNLTSLMEVLKTPNPLALLREKKDIHAQIEEFLESLLAEQGNRLIVFVDELDRCNPSYAVRLLERIKHYFSNDRVTFVFSVNTSELQHTIKQYYGVGFDAGKYLDKFFDLRVDLPPANLMRYYQEIGLSGDSSMYEAVCRRIAEINNFTLRETAKFCKIEKIAAYKPFHSGNRHFSFDAGIALRFSLVCIVPIIIGLKISDQSKYDAFMRGEDSSPLHRFMQESDLANALCSDMLKMDETFEASDIAQGKTEVTLSDKLDQIYNALFVHIYDAKSFNIKIGRMSFSQATRMHVLNAVSLLSGYADYSD